MSVTVNPFANSVSVNSTPVNITVSAPGGVTSAFTNPMTTQGDIIVGGVGGAPTRYPIGLANYALISNGTTPTWGPVFQNPMTAAGDLIVGGTGGAPTRVALGPAGTVPTSTGTALAYVMPASGFTSAVLPAIPSGSTLMHVAGATGLLTSGLPTYAANYLLLTPFILPRDCTVTSLGVVITTAAPGNLAAGIYSDTNGSPANLLVSTAKLSTSSFGFVGSSVNYTLQAGVPYWAAVVVDNTTAKFMSLQNGFGSVCTQLFINTGATGNPYIYFDNLGSWSTLPSALSVGGSNVAAPNNIPAVFFNG